MSTEIEKNLPSHERELMTASDSGLKSIRPVRDTPDSMPLRRSLRLAVLLLTRKVESLGVDVSDVKNLMGVDK